MGTLNRVFMAIGFSMRLALLPVFAFVGIMATRSVEDWINDMKAFLWGK